MPSSYDLINSENFDKYPGLLSTLTSENFLEKVKQLKLSHDEIRFLWVNIIKDHDKILTSINSLDDLECISRALTFDVDEFHHQVHLAFRNKLIELKVLHKCIHTMDDFAKVVSKPYKYLGSSYDTDREVIKLFNEFQDQFPALMQRGFPRKSFRNGFFNFLTVLNPELLSSIVRENKEYKWVTQNDTINNDDLTKLLYLLMFYDPRKEEHTLTLLSYSQSKKGEFYSSQYDILIRKNEKSEIEILPPSDAHWGRRDVVLSEKELKFLNDALGDKDQVTLHYSDHADVFNSILKQYSLPNAVGMHVPSCFDKEQTLAFAEAVFPDGINCSNTQGLSRRINALLDDLIKLPVDIVLFALKKIPAGLLSGFSKEILAWPCFVMEENKAYRDALINHFTARSDHGTEPVEIKVISVSDNIHVFMKKPKAHIGKDNVVASEPKSSFNKGQN